MISLPISTGDLHYWSLEFYPFILVAYEETSNSAFWLHIQPFVSQFPECVDPDQKTFNVHVPVVNKLTVRSIDQFQRLSTTIVEKLRTPIMIDSGCQFGGAFDFLFLTTDGHR